MSTSTDLLIIDRLRGELLNIPDLAASDAGGVLYLRTFADSESDRFPLCSLLWESRAAESEESHRETGLVPATAQRVETIFNLAVTAQTFIRPETEATAHSETSIMARRMAREFNPNNYRDLAAISARVTGYFPKGPEPGHTLWLANCTYLFTFIDDLSD